MGDRYYEWDNSKKRLVEYGTYANNSNILRIEMASEVDLGQASSESFHLVPKVRLRESHLGLNLTQDLQWWMVFGKVLDSAHLLTEILIIHFNN